MAISSSANTASALWYCGPGQVEIRREQIAPPGTGEVRVKTLYSAISRGTESLVFAGRVPASEFERMRAPFMAGDFPFPVKYGYAAVGRVENGGGALQGKDIFALFPHQTAFNIPASAAVALPEDVPPRRAVLAAYYLPYLRGQENWTVSLHPDVLQSHPELAPLCGFEEWATLGGVHGPRTSSLNF